MSKHLYINLCSSYSGTDDKSRSYQNEVNTDSKTIHDCFPQDIHVDIPVSAELSQGKIKSSETINAIQKQISDAITSAIGEESIDSCTIILNSHGAFGAKDILDHSVLEVVKYLSKKEMVVSKVCALICNGMRAFSSSEIRASDPTSPAHKKVSGKKATMSILAAKLNALETHIGQTFQIYGFLNAYDPIDNKEEVLNVLQGITLDTALPVITKVASSHIKKLDDYITALTYVESHSAADDLIQWNKYTNQLGRILSEMKNRIMECLNAKLTISPNDELLFDSVIEGNHTAEQLTGVSFHHLYNSWKKGQNEGNGNNLNDSESKIRKVLSQYINELEKSSSIPTLQETTPPASSDSERGSIGLKRHSTPEKTLPSVINDKDSVTPALEHALSKRAASDSLLEGPIKKSARTPEKKAVDDELADNHLSTQRISVPSLKRESSRSQQEEPSHKAVRTPEKSSPAKSRKEILHSAETTASPAFAGLTFRLEGRDEDTLEASMLVRSQYGLFHNKKHDDRQKSQSVNEALFGMRK